MGDGETRGKGKPGKDGERQPTPVVGEMTQCWLRGPRAPERQEIGK